MSYTKSWWSSSVSMEVHGKHTCEGSVGKLLILTVLVNTLALTESKGTDRSFRPKSLFSPCIIMCYYHFLKNVLRQ
jgi:hypothetical protein